MPKSLERLIELLPVPVLLAVAAMFSLAWLVKELRPHSAYGPALRDKVFQRGAALIVATLIAGFLLQAGLDRFGLPQFQRGERGLCVAEFDGDKDNVVQRQTTEFLRALFVSDDLLANIRVERYTVKPSSHEQARVLAERHGAFATVWGSVIPGAGANMVDFNLSIKDQNKETRKLCPQYPDIRDFTTAVATLMKASPPVGSSGADDVQVAYVKRQVQELRADNERLVNAVAQMQRTLSASLLARMDPSSLQKQSGGEFKTKRRFGVFVGIDQYPQLGSNLQFATKDSNDMAAVFRSNDGADVTILHNADASRSTLTGTLARIKGEARADDQIWIYFSGIGFQSSGSGYFALSGASSTNLLRDSMPVSEIVNWMKDLAAKQVILIADACHSGLAAHKGPASSNLLRVIGDREGGKVWLAAGASNELALEDASLGHGVFTYYVLQGLSGKADANADGYVTPSELWEYAKVAGLTRTSAAAATQHPWMQVLEGSADFAIAHVQTGPAISK